MSVELRQLIGEWLKTEQTLTQWHIRRDERLPGRLKFQGLELLILGTLNNYYAYVSDIYVYFPSLLDYGAPISWPSYRLIDASDPEFFAKMRDHMSLIESYLSQPKNQLKKSRKTRRS